MSSSLSFDSSTNELPTLVRMASIVLNKCAEEQADFGDNVRFELVKPILELASANLVARVEAACPRIELDTEYIWKAHCNRQFSVLMREYNTDTWEGSRPWKNAFFQCKQEEALRLKQLSSKIRNQRQDLEDRKKSHQVKFTDREPPSKRQRTGGWGGPSVPKTLFQKTRSDTTKLQKNLYTRKAAPPKPRPISAFAASASNYSTASGKTYSTGSSTCSSSMGGSSSSSISGSSISGSSSRSIGSALGASSRALIWDSAPQRTTTTAPTSTTPTATSTPTTTGVTVRTVVRRPAPGPSAVPQYIPKSKTSPTRPQPQSSAFNSPALPSKMAVRNSSGVPALGDSPFDSGVPPSSLSPVRDVNKGTSSPSVSSPRLPRPKKTAMSSMFLPSKRATVKS